MKWFILTLLLLALAGCTSVEEINNPYLTSEFDLVFDSCIDSYCFYNGTDSIIAISVQSYDNVSQVEGAYQYSSSHMINSDWIVVENELGDMSKFLVWNESETYYAHYWIVDGLDLIDVTSSGSYKATQTVQAIAKSMTD